MPRSVDLEIRPRRDGRGYELIGPVVGSRGSLWYLEERLAEDQADFIAASMPCHGTLRIYDAGGTLQRERPYGSASEAAYAAG